MPPELLSVTQLAVERGSRAILTAVDLTVAEGEVVGVLGPNGAGKTTLFQILTGLLPPDQGQLRFAGQDLPFGDRRFRSQTGVVFQDPAMDKRLTARENLDLAARLHGQRGLDRRGRVDELIARTGLGDRADEPVSQLSGGMKRRFDLARAVIHRPRLLILDEPTGGLDEASFRRAWEEILDQRRESGLSVIVTSHRPEEAERCDRLAILDGGRIVATDTPEALKNQVPGDRLTIETPEPEDVARLLVEKLQLIARVDQGRVLVEEEEAHKLIPRLFEVVPAGLLTSVSLRRAGLAEAFLHLTGHGLDGVALGRSAAEAA